MKANNSSPPTSRGKRPRRAHRLLNQRNLLIAFGVVCLLALAVFAARVASRSAPAAAGRADPALLRRWTDEVPVTFVDGRQHDYWRVDPERLRAALVTAHP